MTQDSTSDTAGRNQRSSQLSRPHVHRVEVTVTDALIDKAIPSNSGHCMIAEAIKASVPHAKAVTVDLISIRWTDPREGKRYIYFTPPGAQAALLEFDNGLKPEAFRFLLRNPAQIVPSGTESRKPGARRTQGMVRTSLSTNPKESPTKIGGKTPGRAVLTNAQSGRMRGFGLRQAGRLPRALERIEENAT
jgi:hypothetical protein